MHTSKMIIDAFIVVQLVSVNVSNHFAQIVSKYHISVKRSKISRWLLLNDPDISIWYDGISCQIRSEFAGDPNCYHFCWPKLGVMTTYQYSYLKNRG